VWRAGGGTFQERECRTEWYPAQHPGHGHAAATGSPGSAADAGVGYWLDTVPAHWFMALIALRCWLIISPTWTWKVIKTRHYCYAAAAAAAIIDRRRGAFGLFSNHACLPRAHIVNVSKAGWHLGKGCVSCMSI